MKASEITAVEFFQRRFPNKNIRFEIECGYFEEWVQRFESNSPESFMDEQSLEVWKEMGK